MSWFLCALTLIGILCVALKIYLKLTIRRNGSYTTLVGKTAIITGANTGIGYITALDFAARGARVILACRNKDRAEDAQRKIVKASGNENVVYKLVDMASLQSVRNFAADINKTEDKIDILVNNAGAAFQDNEYTDDGIQTILHINHISVFLLTHLLLDKLKQSAPSRIVNVSSRGASIAKLNITNIEDLNKAPTKSAFSDVDMYNDSKLCNILFTTELAKKIDGTGITANALHPGAIKTEILRNMKGIMKMIYSIIINLYFLTPEEGAQTQIYVAVSKEVEGINGGLFANCKQIELYDRAKDLDLARKLWLKSEELAKLSANEKM